MIGKTLAHYKINEKIGAGGMGEVYRATDSNLGRDVALKILPSAFARNVERMARFEREARVLAQLNHPGIASIFGIGHEDGYRFLAMELAEGEDLAARLLRGPVAGAGAIDVARQIAEALEEAHAQGIVHRDLKPANIKVSAQGKVKILDFGLAKALTDEPQDSGVLENSPTVTPDVTRAGFILGTAAYMSPEQARGLTIDARTDVWAFGCVIYEMLTGKAPFRGATISDVIAAVLEREPDWTALPGDTPPAVARVLRRCLTKDPNQRLHSIADARIELSEAATGASGELVAKEPSPAPRRRWLLPVAAFGSFLVGVLAVRLMPQEEIVAIRNDARPVHLVLPTPADAQPVPLPQNSSVAIAPDGSFAVWVGTATAEERGLVLRGDHEATASTVLFRRSFDGTEAVPIEGTLGASSAFVSPDGKWIGFYDAPAGKLKKVARDGGAPIDICDANTRRATWSDDGRIFFGSPFGGLLEVSDRGGNPRTITSPDRESNVKTHRFPHALPGSKALLFTRATAEIPSYDDADVALLMLETGEIRILVEGGTYPKYAPTGHIVYARAGELLAVPFDMEQLEVTGPPFRVLHGLIMADGWGSAQYDFSDDGTLVYLRGGPGHYYFETLVLHRDGQIEPVPIEPDHYGEVDVSPDGNSLAISILGANASVCVYDLNRRTMTRLTEAWDNHTPVWDPSGNLLAFGSNRGGEERVWLMASDGAGQPELLLEESSFFAVDWHPDGSLLAFTRLIDGQADIWTVSRDGSRIEPAIVGGSQEYAPRFSPDGRNVVYVSDESGRAEVYVQPFPPTGRKWRLSESGGHDPIWSPDGRALYFWNGNQLMEVPVRTEPDFVPARAQLLVETRLSDVQSYDVFPDGERFAVVARPTDPGERRTLVRPGGRRKRPLHPPADPDLQVVVNWFAGFEN